MSDPYRKPVLVIPPPGAEPKPSPCPFPMNWWEGLGEWDRTDLRCGGCGGEISPVYATIVTKDGRLLMRWPCCSCKAINFTKTWEETMRDRTAAKRAAIRKVEPASHWRRFVAWIGRVLVWCGPPQNRGGVP